MNHRLKLMTRKYAAVLTAGVLTAASSVCLCGCTWNYGNGISFSSQIVSGTVELEEFDKLDIDVSSYDVLLKRGDKFCVEYRAAKGRVPTVLQKDGKVTVAQPKKISINIDLGSVSGDTGYTITVPDDRIITVDAGSTSGDIMIDHVNVTGEVGTIAGDVLITDSEGEKLEIETSSGDIGTDGIKNEKSVLSSISGNISLMRHDSGDITCDTTSGDITMNNSPASKIKCTTTSGEVDLEINGKPEDFSYDIETTSGEATVNDESVEDEYKNNDGKDGRIIVSTVSGDIVVNVK